MIFNIQRCSIHDGNGLRTLVFFKGCPLRCKWCANPESQDYGQEIIEVQSKCIGCEACLDACVNDAILRTSEGLIIERDKCRKCFKCTQKCYALAKSLVGREYTIDELYKEIEKDKFFYEFKGGGVTFSGGEPLTYPDYLFEIAKKCKKNHIDVAIESCGFGDFDKFKKVLPYVDSMFLDIKHMDSSIHKELTGQGNELILSNIKRIDSYGVDITIRTPIIPSLNDSENNIIATAKFISGLSNVKEYELLPYHQFGINKYKSLGRKYVLNNIEPPADKKMGNLVKCANNILDGDKQVCFYTKENKKIIVK